MKSAARVRVLCDLGAYRLAVARSLAKHPKVFVSLSDPRNHLADV
jgi:hypothetical protein